MNSFSFIELYKVVKIFVPNEVRNKAKICTCYLLVILRIITERKHILLPMPLP